MKRIIFSHASDIDGMGSVILAKILFGDIDIRLVEINEVKDVLSSFFKNVEASVYDEIYIADLNINVEIANEINNSLVRKKVKLFDHHSYNFDIDKYEWATVIIEKDDSLTSATSLFYEYLCNVYPANSIIKKETIKKFVELIRRNDTWEWKTKYNDIDAPRLSNLFAIYGKERFINTFSKRLIEEDAHIFSEIEEELLAIEKERINNYINEKEKEMLYYKYENYNVGVVFAENYRSELGNTLAERTSDKTDFIIIINISNSISYRGIKDINLNEVARVFGGGGHQKASGSPLPDKILENIVSKLFRDELKIKE